VVQQVIDGGAGQVLGMISSNPLGWRLELTATLRFSRSRTSKQGSPAGGLLVLDVGAGGSVGPQGARRTTHR
jgi:hypothetical protein